ncbi:uncharacterized protein [Primulina eburnea]|uniref:uncharacterized protein n=1 Tax=Primulina eburnea TaxID=1245227 RepID=UPI003C6C3FC3
MPRFDFDALITAHSGEGNDLKISCKTHDEEEYSSKMKRSPVDNMISCIRTTHQYLSGCRKTQNTIGLIEMLFTIERIPPERFSANLKSKASIIGLPKTQKATFVDSSCRRTCKSSTNARLFPKRTASAGKSTIAVTEPGSPKVSCTGRVRSKRGRRRSNSSKRSDKPAEKSRACYEKPEAEESKTGVAKKEKKKKTGFYFKVMSIFRSQKTNKNPSRSYSRKVAELQAEKPPAVEALRKSASIKAAPEPPGLGGMKRFASGRQSGSWLAEDLNQVLPEPLYFDRRLCITGGR